MKKVKGEPRKSPHLQKINNLNKVIFFAKGINRPEIPKNLPEKQNPSSKNNVLGLKINFTNNLQG